MRSSARLPEAMMASVPAFAAAGEVSMAGKGRASWCRAASRWSALKVRGASVDFREVDSQPASANAAMSGSRIRLSISVEWCVQVRGISDKITRLNKHVSPFAPAAVDPRTLQARSGQLAKGFIYGSIGIKRPTTLDSAIRTGGARSHFATSGFHAAGTAGNAE